MTDVKNGKWFGGFWSGVMLGLIIMSAFYESGMIINNDESIIEFRLELDDSISKLKKEFKEVCDGN